MQPNIISQYIIFAVIASYASLHAGPISRHHYSIQMFLSCTRNYRQHSSHLLPPLSSDLFAKNVIIKRISANRMSGGNSSMANMLWQNTIALSAAGFADQRIYRNISWRCRWRYTHLACLLLVVCLAKTIPLSSLHIFSSIRHDERSADIQRHRQFLSLVFVGETWQQPLDPLSHSKVSPVLPRAPLNLTFDALLHTNGSSAWWWLLSVRWMLNAFVGSQQCQSQINDELPLICQNQFPINLDHNNQPQKLLLCLSIVICVWWRRPFDPLIPHNLKWAINGDCEMIWTIAIFHGIKWYQYRIWFFSSISGLTHICKKFKTERQKNDQ